MSNSTMVSAATTSSTSGNAGATLLLLKSFVLNMDENLVALLAFMERTNLNLAMEPQELNIVQDTFIIMPSLLTFLQTSGVVFVFSKEEKREQFPIPYSYYNLFTKKIENVGRIPAEALEEIPFIKASELPNWIMGFVAQQVGNMKATDIAELFSLLTFGTELKGSVVRMNANYGGMEIDFAQETFLLGDINKQANPFVRVGKYSVSSKGILFILGLEIAKLGKSNLWKAKSIVSTDMSGLWNKEQNYGVKATDSNAYLLNGCNTLTFVESDSRRVVGFPFLAITNGKFDVSLVEPEAVLFCDKMAKKVLYDEAAGNAAGQFGAIVSYVSKSGKKKKQKGQYTILETGAKKEHGCMMLGAKLLNRIIQSLKYQASDLYRSFDINNLESVRTAGAFGTRIMNEDKDCMMEGQLVKVAMTNTTLCRGSGVATMNPSFFFVYGVDKKLDSRVNYNELTGEALDKYEAKPCKGHENFFMFLDDIEDALNSIPKDRIFKPGESIIAFDYGSGRKHVLFSNKTKNQFFIVTGASVLRPNIDAGDYRPTYTKIELKVRAVKQTKFAKLRGLGIKATTLVDLNDKWFDVDGNAVDYPADIIFNNETRKGHVSVLALYANGNPNILSAVAEGGNDGCFYKVTYKDNTPPRYIDLMNPYNEVTVWANNNTQFMSVQSSMPRFEYDQSLQAMQSVGQELTWKIVEDHGDWVVVQDTCQVLVGYMPINYEISTADESVGTGSLTPEMMAGMSLLSRKLVEVIYEEARSVREALFGLLNMANCEMAENTVQMDLQDPEAINAFQALVGDLSGLSDRQIVNVMAETYPDGCLFTANGLEGLSTLMLDWYTIGSTMTFIQGSADQISQEIIAAVRYISNSAKTEASGYDGVIYHIVGSLSSSLYAWIVAGLSSQGIIKSMSRSSKCLINAKVRTCYDLSLIPDADGLPKAIVHPDCGVAEYLAKFPTGEWDPTYVSEITYESKEEFIQQFSLEFPSSKVISKGMMEDSFVVKFFNPYSLNGCLIAAQRIPMFMPAACKLVISTVLEPSHVGILPSVWAKGNSGDSDGDGIGVINMSMRGVTLEEAVTMNKSVVGLGGYDVIYSQVGLPFADFLERPKKKALIQPDGFAYASFIPHDFEEEYAFNTDIAHVGLKEIHENTAKHYDYNVGAGYGLASALTCWAAVCALNPDWADKMPLLEKAILVVWTLIYEGLGLSGFTFKAAEFFQVLRVASFGMGKDANGKPQYQFARNHEGEVVVPFGDEFKAEKYEAFDAVDYILEALNLPKDDEWTTVVEIILTFNGYRMKYGKLDRGTLNFEPLTEDQLMRISMIGVFRHMGRGTDPATGLELESIAAGNDPNDYISNFKLLDSQGYVSELLPSDTWMYKLYANGVNFMTAASNTVINATYGAALRNR